MSASADSVVIPLNEPEHLYAAMDGLAGTMGSIYMMRFDSFVPVEQVRAVMREMVSAIPRFRGIVERGALRSHLRILPDNAVTDHLFDEAWRVDAHVDPSDPKALERYHNRLINESLSLERGLACRFCYLPHANVPVLFVVLHHLLFDGRSGIYVLSAIAKRLNSDEPVQPVPLEPVPMLEALRPKKWWQWPSAARNELRYRGAEKRLLAGLNIQMVNRQDQPFLSTYAVRHYEAPCATAQLRSAGRKLGLSFSGVVNVVLAEAFLSYAPDDPKAAAVIRQAVDLRAYQAKDKGHGPLLGNQVGSFLVTEVGRKPIMERAASVRDQLRAGLDLYDQRQMGFGVWLGNLFTFMGPNLLAYFGTKLQRQLKMPRISCYATNMGNITAELNPPGARFKVTHMYGCGPSLSMLHGLVEMNNHLSMTLVWQRCEATDAEIDDYFRRLDQAFLAVLDEVGKLEPRRRAKPKAEA